MRKKISAFLSLIMALQLMLAAVPALAQAEESVPYTAPESPAVTFNMNLDWKFFETGTDREIDYAMSLADKDGKKFYEVGYDDSDWKTVSIPHAVNGDNAFMNAIADSGGGYKREVLLYRKTFTVPEAAEGSKYFFEMEGIRQAAYVWVNGQPVGYYEAGVTAFGFDISNYVTPGEQAVIAICEDGTTARGTTGRIPYETVPGEPWGSSYTPDNYKTTVGDGVQFQWNTKDFNEAQIGLVYDAYLHVTGSVYQTLPLYNNLKTTGNYIYATDFDIRENKATINVQAEIRNESGADGTYTLDVAVVDHEGNAVYQFSSAATEVKAASDAGAVYETAVEDDAYSQEKLDYTYPVEDENDMPTVSEDGDVITYATVDGVLQATEHNEIGKTQVNTPDVTYITASYDADDVRFWSLDDPYLYTVYTVLRDADGNAVDVKSEETGFRKVTYSQSGGLQINDKSVWLRGYAQRSTNEWAVVGSATDWLNDYDMKLLKENNANFIRWMHVAPKPAQVRSTDKYGIAVVCPAGDKEGTAPCGRQWTQRVEAMRDAMIYYRNSPSVIFWETGNSPMGMEAKANEMAELRDAIDPYGMRFIGARSTRSANELDYEYNYAGTMYGNYADAAKSAMAENGIYGPIMETEYARDESPRRVWDDYSPPDYDYVNKWLGDGASKDDGYDVWDLTQEEVTVNNVKEYADNYYANRMGGGGRDLYSAAAMMVWSDSNMHGRNSGTENCRTSGRVDPVRQTKEMYYGTQAAQSDEAAVHIIGHWSYPEVSDSTYNYFEKVRDASDHYWTYTDNVLKRDPTTKTVYVIGSAAVAKIELYRIDGDEQTLLGTDEEADSYFVYQFDDIDVTLGDGVIAKAYDARGTEIAAHQIDRTYDAVSIRLTPVTAPEGWKADGSDIAYFDVEVIDENGNVCALNYDRINFTYEGAGEFLGGYNSGMGSGCFQNSAASTGISNYFGGAKDEVSTIGKDYVYAENGTNRIFVKSTRDAGTFTLTAQMDGMLPVSQTITSTAVETEGGLTTEMPSTWDPGVAPPPVDNTVSPLVTLGEKTNLDWGNFIIVKEEDTNVYYDITFNGEVLDVSPRARAGINNMIFGPIVQVLDALKAAGADLTYTYDDSVQGSAELAMTANGHVYRFIEGQNLMYIDGYDQANSELTEDMPVIEDGVMIAQLNSMISKIPGVSYTIDREALTFDITFAAAE